jgi:transcriptional regulator with XRE-family HTH domain
MRPSIGTHNLARLRALIGLEQKQFAAAVNLSVATISKAETQKRPLTRQVAQHVADSTGISVEWLLQNDKHRAPCTPRGKPYSRHNFDQAQMRARWMQIDPRIKPSVWVRRQLLMNYAKSRDLFLRPEMYRHFFKYLTELELLCGRFWLKADLSEAEEAMSSKDFIREEQKQRQPDVLYPGIIKDAEKCWDAEKRQRERREREEVEKAKSIAPFLSPKGKGTPTIRKLKSITAHAK